MRSQKKDDTFFEIDTWLGVKPRIKATTKEDFYVTINKKDIRYLTVSLDYKGPIQAPIYKDTEIAKIIVTQKDNTIKEIPLYAAEDVKSKFF